MRAIFLAFIFFALINIGDELWRLNHTLEKIHAEQKLTNNYLVHKENHE